MVEWTKFRDASPKQEDIFVTDCKQIWVTHRSKWKENCPENYLWSPIEFPEVPKPPKQEHFCESCTKFVTLKCHESRGDLMMTIEDRINNSKTHIMVAACPICGYQVKNG